MLVALKVVLAPLMIAACTLAARRWGESVGGWVLGLPLISGPVSVLLLVEHGPGFARKAAGATLLGLVAGAAFSACYALVAARQPWWRSLLAGVVACAATAATLAGIRPSFGWSVAIVLVVLAALVLVTGAPRQPSPTRPPAGAELAMRMAIASAVVYAVTSEAALLGPTVAGILAPLPVLAAVMASSVHRTCGRDVAGNLLRGALVGSWGGAAFFAVVGAAMSGGNAVATYAVATVAALASAALATRVQYAVGRVRRSPLPA